MILRIHGEDPGDAQTAPAEPADEGEIPMKIVVLAGGISTERDVSLVSGISVCRALRENGHRAIFVDLFLGLPEVPADLETLFDAPDGLCPQVRIQAAPADLEAVRHSRADQSPSHFGPHVLDICAQADIVFLALHGQDGEDGRVQATFDLLGIRYTGTDYVSSALSMDKSLTKEIFAFYGIPAPAGVQIRKDAEMAKGACPVAFPCVVKACRGGSSVGVSIAHDDKEYQEAVRDAFLYDDEAVVEQYIEGREFTCAVIDGKALPIVEIAPLNGFYDYKNKYQPGSTIETCPADLSPELTAEMQRYAEMAYEALGMRSYARMDFMMDASDHSIYCLEANTLPGMTPTSLLPQEAAVIGMSFEDLCEKLIEVSLK